MLLIGMGETQDSRFVFIDEGPRAAHNCAMVETTSTLPILNIAAYKFVRLDELAQRKQDLLARCEALQLKGSILLSHEGINMFLAGETDSIRTLLTELRAQPEFSDLKTKDSFSERQPFNRMLVKLKKEIIAFGMDGIDPEQRSSPKLAATELKKWLDEGRPVKLLDTRNDYEIRLGTFVGAEKLDLDHFREFPKAVERMESEADETPIVMFCTGGIRCEKAGPYMEQRGFKNVYQLEGGILKYFEDCGGEHYDGDCFVFDQRVALDPQLNETETTQCYRCQEPLTAEEQQSERYVHGVSCPYCYRSDEDRMAERIAERHERIRELTDPLPGSQPYDNVRPVHIHSRAAGLPLIDFLIETYPFVDPLAWPARFEQGLIRFNDKPVTGERLVQAGERYEHHFPDTVEPPVNADIRILHEDEDLVVVRKPAPLPMHPCGRFNRNSLASILDRVYEPHKMRLAHRLDANTSGVVVFSRHKQAATYVQPQFSAGTVKKRYLCLVQGQPEYAVGAEFESRARISTELMPAGSRRTGAEGQESHTEFTMLAHFDTGERAGNSLVEARPITGRTNQIRIHLWDLGFPIVGDPMYLPDREIKPRQTLTPDEPRLFLHAFEVTLRHPSTKELVSYASMRPEWAKI